MKVYFRIACAALIALGLAGPASAGTPSPGAVSEPLTGLALAAALAGLLIVIRRKERQARANRR